MVNLFAHPQGKAVLALATCGALLFFLNFLLPTAFIPMAQAGSSDNVYGFAWSDNIGWISFNCTDLGTCGTVDYGVQISDSTGVFSGYAWNDAVGWISFNTAELGGCPSGVCESRLGVPVSTEARGWAKALAGGGAGSGGWEGWISLSCESDGFGCSG